MIPLRSVEALCAGVLDYAGIFPPASLAMTDAVMTYARFRASEDAWMLGAFVVSAERFGEVDQPIGPVSMVVHATSPADVEHVLGEAGSLLRIAAIEFRPVPAERIGALAAAVPREIQAYFEVDPELDLHRPLDAVAACGAFAKLRTGGVTPAAFPTATGVLRFFRACDERRLAAKATAGLHHAVTGSYPLTYDAISQSARMYGFVNMCAAAALVRTGSADQDLLAVLAESSPAAFRFSDHGMEWRHHRLSNADLAATRQTLFRSFGTCSLQEPIDDVKRMRAA